MDPTRSRSRPCAGSRAEAFKKAQPGLGQQSEQPKSGSLLQAAVLSLSLKVLQPLERHVFHSIPEHPDLFPNQPSSFTGYYNRC